MALTTGLAVGVFAVGVLLVGLGAVGVAFELPSFWDPCMTWGEGRSGNGTQSVTLSPDDDCRSRSGTSETKGGAALRMTLVFGTAMVGGTLAAVGAWRQRATPTFAAAILMTGETVVLFLGISAAFVVTLAAAILFLVAAVRWRRPPPSASDGL